MHDNLVKIARCVCHGEKLAGKSKHDWSPNFTSNRSFLIIGTLGGKRVTIQPTGSLNPHRRVQLGSWFTALALFSPSYCGHV